MNYKKKRKGGIVFSTESGKMCPNCGNTVTDCTCSNQTSIQNRDGIVRVSRETKGRKGKGVTVINGIPLAHENLKELAKELKQKCGSGGTVKNGIIEIQGDHRDLLVKELLTKGYTAKRSGG